MVTRGIPGERDATRAKVLAAAERLFLTRGYLAVTVEDIAVKAGFTRGAVYSSFSGKDDLFLALAEERARRQLSDTREALTRALSGQARLDAVGRVLAREVERTREWARAEMEFTAAASNRPEFLQRIATAERAGRDMIAELLGDACAALGITPPDDLDEVAVAVRALARGLTAEWNLDPNIDIARIFASSFARLLAPQVPELERFPASRKTT